MRPPSPDTAKKGRTPPPARGKKGKYPVGAPGTGHVNMSGFAKFMIAAIVFNLVLFVAEIFSTQSAVPEPAFVKSVAGEHVVVGGGRLQRGTAKYAQDHGASGAVSGELFEEPEMVERGDGGGGGAAGAGGLSLRGRRTDWAAVVWSDPRFPGHNLLYAVRSALRAARRVSRRGGGETEARAAGQTARVIVFHPHGGAPHPMHVAGRDHIVKSFRGAVRSGEITFAERGVAPQRVADSARVGSDAASFAYAVSALPSLSEFARLADGRAGLTTLILSNETLCEPAGVHLLGAASAASREHRGEAGWSVLMAGAGVSGVSFPAASMAVFRGSLESVAGVDAALHTPAQRTLESFATGTGIVGAAAVEVRQALRGGACGGIEGLHKTANAGSCLANVVGGEQGRGKGNSKGNSKGNGKGNSKGNNKGNNKGNKKGINSKGKSKAAPLLASTRSILADDPSMDHSHVTCSDEPVLDIASRELKSCPEGSPVCAPLPME